MDWISNQSPEDFRIVAHKRKALITDIPVCILIISRACRRWCSRLHPHTCSKAHTFFYPNPIATAEDAHGTEKKQTKIKRHDGKKAHRNPPAAPGVSARLFWVRGRPHMHRCICVQAHTQVRHRYANAAEIGQVVAPSARAFQSHRQGGIRGRWAQRWTRSSLSCIDIGVGFGSFPCCNSVDFFCNDLHLKCELILFSLYFGVL